MQSVLSQQRQAVSLESDEQLMEALAARRSELRDALQQKTFHQQQGWMTTTRSSFFLVSKEPLVALLQNELDQVEQELRILCKSIMSETKEQHD